LEEHRTFLLGGYEITTYKNSSKMMIYVSVPGYSTAFASHHARVPVATIL
jgi:hypothetical protein